MEFTDHLLDVYVREVLYQIEMAEGAFYRMVSALGGTADGYVQPDHTIEPFGAAQVFLSAAAMVSKLLFPPSNKPLPQQRARVLRAAIGVDHTSLLKSRDLRNDFEHFDERLDEFLDAYASSDLKILIDRNIGPISAWLGMAGASGVSVLRNIHPETAKVSILGNEINTAQLWEAMAALILPAEEWRASRGFLRPEQHRPASKRLLPWVRNG